MLSDDPVTYDLSTRWLAPAQQQDATFSTTQRQAERLRQKGAPTRRRPGPGSSCSRPRLAPTPITDPAIEATFNFGQEVLGETLYQDGTTIRKLARLLDRQGEPCLLTDEGAVKSESAVEG